MFLCTFALSLKMVVGSSLEEHLYRSIMACFFTGEVTAEELRQRLDGAKERVSSQPRTEPHPQTTEFGEQEGSSAEGEERGAGGRSGAGKKGTCTGWVLLARLHTSRLHTKSLHIVWLCTTFNWGTCNYHFR